MSATVWIVTAKCEDPGFDTTGPIVGIAKTRAAARHLAEAHANSYIKSMGEDADQDTITIDGDTFHGDEDTFDVALEITFEEVALYEDEGPTRDQAIDALVSEYQEWMRREGLTLGSADEHVEDQSLTDNQRAWLREFIVRWDIAEAERWA